MTSIIKVRSTSTHLFAGTWRPLLNVITTLYYVAIIFHHLGYLCAKFCFFCDIHCWAIPWRNQVLWWRLFPFYWEYGNEYGNTKNKKVRESLTPGKWESRNEFPIHDLYIWSEITQQYVTKDRNFNIPQTHPTKCLWNYVRLSDSCGKCCTQIENQFPNTWHVNLTVFYASILHATENCLNLLINSAQSIVSLHRW